MLRQLEYRTEYLIQDWRPEIQNESILEVRGRKEQDNFWSLEEVPLIYIWEDLQRWQMRALRKFSLRLTPLWIVVGKPQHSSYTTEAGAHSATWQRPSRLETVSQLAGREPGCLPAPRSRAALSQGGGSTAALHPRAHTSVCFLPSHPLA